MADGPLAWVYSQGNRLQRGLNALLANPIGSLEQAAGAFQDYAREDQRLNALAFADPKNPMRVTDQGAMRELIDRTMAGPMGFAPVGMAKPSRAANEALGLYHDIGGGAKLSRPPSEMTARTVPNAARPPLVERRTISPEQMVGGEAVPLYGDRAAAGRVLTHVDDVKLKRPVELEGGPDYMRANPGVWRSDQGIITRIADTVKDPERPAYGVYTAMTPTGVDFNTMLTDTVLGQLRPRALPRDLVDQFDSTLRGFSEAGRGFVGLNSPRLRDQLLTPDNGPLRKDFIDRMSLAPFQKAGLPDIPAARKAITEPELLDVPLGSSGYAIGRLGGLEAVNPTPALPHGTYPVELGPAGGGTAVGSGYVGGLEQQVPWQVMFPQFFKERRAAGADPATDPRSFMMSKFSQRLDQEWLDGVMEYLRQAAAGRRGSSR